jgi:hypothetical protein
MRRLWLVALLVVCARPAERLDSPTYLKDLMQFNRAYDLFFRAVMGCPKGARDIEECNPRLGAIDYGAYLRAAKLAGRVFPQ